MESGEGEDKTLEVEFRECEKVIEDCDSSVEVPNLQERLKACVEKLQEIAKKVDRLGLFSSNDQLEELPTSSLPYLLVPAYLGYGIENLKVELEKRETYLKAARIHLREFLERLLLYDVILFKLPWISEEGAEHAPSGSMRPVDPAQLRQQKLNRLEQQDSLQEALDKLKLERERNNDESSFRSMVIVLLRVWALRAMPELERTEQEIQMLEYRSKIQQGTESLPPAKPIGEKRMPFIITRNEEQKKVFGLGYPSVPTYTVDEWYDGMVKTGRFATSSSKTFTITGDEGEEDESHHTESEDEDDEEKRKKRMERDDWKDWNPRGWGNTYNKG